MDIQRQNAPRRRLIRQVTVVASVLVSFALLGWGVMRMKPAMPSVDRATVLLDTVKRGPMVREVRGLGTLVPEEVVWISAPAEGRVEKVLAKPGALVGRETVLLLLRNPELETAAVDAEYQAKAAEAQYADLKARLSSEQLNQQAGVARLKSEYRQAQIKAEADQELAKQGLLPAISLRLSTNSAEELGGRLEIEQQRLAIGPQSAEVQLRAQLAQVERLHALERLKREQVVALTVRAGSAGVLQQLPAEIGRNVTAGAVLAKVAQPEKLIAELKISETLAKDIRLGQRAAIDTHNGVVMGRVARIDPAVKDGTVTVDVRLAAALPQGARPDLSVDGNIELERLEDVVYMARPPLAQPHITVSVFKLEPDRKGAVRVVVRLGRASVNAVEVLGGLRPGDEVIVSDSSAWNGHDAIRLR